VQADRFTNKLIDLIDLQIKKENDSLMMTASV